MAAKTPTWSIETGLAHVETLYFADIDNADTYTSTKIGTIRAVHVTPNRDETTTDKFTATFSGAVVTFQAEGTTTNVPCTVTLYGGV